MFTVDCKQIHRLEVRTLHRILYVSHTYSLREEVRSHTHTHTPTIQGGEVTAFPLLWCVQGPCERAAAVAHKQELYQCLFTIGADSQTRTHEREEEVCDPLFCQLTSSSWGATVRECGLLAKGHPLTGKQPLEQSLRAMTRPVIQHV